MTAELRRGLVFTVLGLLCGFALVVAVMGPGELARRARAVVSPDAAPLGISDLSGAPGTAPRDGARQPDRDKQAALGSLGEPAQSPAPAGPNPGGPDKPAARDAAAPASTPSLDIVRVEPNGDIVIAGRSAPNATIEILRDNRPIARGVADAAGQFAIVPPTLPTGNSEILVRAIGPGGEHTDGRQSVAVVVAQNRTAKPLVAVSSPDKPTDVVSQPDEPADAMAAGAAGRTPEKPPQPMSALPDAGGQGGGEPTPVKISAVDAQEGGRLDVTGRATAWSTLRLYLNDTLVASGQAGPDGKIAFTIGRGIKAGGYRIRVDQVDPKTGRVAHRAQVAFSVPESTTAKVARNEPAVPPPPGKPGADGKALDGLEVRTPGGETLAAGTPAPAPGAESRTAARQAANGKAPPPRATASSGRAGDGRMARGGPASGDELAAGGASASRSADDPRRSTGTPSLAIATGAPNAASPSPETDRRGATALSPRLPPAAGAQDPAAIAQSPGAPQPGAPAIERFAKAPSPAIAGSAPVPSGQAGTVFVAEISTAKITRGDNLWQISRRSYGNGMRYTVIFDANKDQIRDPHLIYPGQIFVLPKDAPSADRPGTTRG